MRRDTLAFSTLFLLSQVLSGVRPSSWTWTMIMLTRLRKCNFKIKIKMAVTTSIEIHEASRLVDSIYSEAVEQAQFVFCYHARVPYLCGVMAHLMLSAILWATWLVELLTRLESVCCLSLGDDCE